jgi:DNA-directed RNA polymerase subunit RPC12/RpoP
MSLNCPYCNGKLKKGKASIHGTVGGFLLYGLSHENLYFKSESEMEIEVLGSNNTTPSMLCEDCGIVILNKEVIEQIDIDRDIMIELLTLFTSNELQESIMESNPETNIHKEIINDWILFYSSDKKELMESFNESELRMLSEINILILAENWFEVDIVANKLLKSIIKN